MGTSQPAPEVALVHLGVAERIPGWRGGGPRMGCGQCIAGHAERAVGGEGVMG
jgi:hypothetical protein